MQDLQKVIRPILAICSRFIHNSVADCTALDPPPTISADKPTPAAPKPADKHSPTTPLFLWNGSGPRRALSGKRRSVVNPRSRSIKEQSNHDGEKTQPQ